MVQDHEGCFLKFVQERQNRKPYRLTALDLVTQVTKTFPSFCDQVDYEGQEGTYAARNLSIMLNYFQL